MFEIDKKRIKVCIEHDDYFSALEYAILVKNNYTNKERGFFEDIIKNVRLGKYI